jgi:two-component sensor histidine kinase
MLRRETLGLPRDPKSFLAYGIELVVIAIVYLAVSKVSLTLASINPSATPIWPTTGFALAAVLLRGYRVIPAIFAGALIVNATTAGSIATSLSIATGNTLESLIGAYLINRWSHGLATFDTPSGVARFTLIALFPSTFVSATVGVTSLTLAGFANPPDFFPVWMTWWMGDLAGALVITPAIVLWWRTARRSFQRQELIQSGLVYSSAIAVGLIAFSPLFEESPARASLAFLAALPLIWAALWRNRRDTAATALILSAFAVWGTLSNSGPFVRGNLNDSFLLLLAFMISVTVPSMALSAEVTVRKRHEEHVDFIMHELSHRSNNLLSIVQSMANQVARHTDSFQTFFPAFSTRLRAFAETHDLLVGGDWRGAPIRELVRVQLRPFHDLSDRSVEADGPDLTLGPKAAEQIGLGLHELATNAAKHGALSSPRGNVGIRWRLESHESGEEWLRITWKEVCDLRISPPEHLGFGMLVITKIVPASLQGTASLEFEPDGVRWVLLAPSSLVLIGANTDAPQAATEVMHLQRIFAERFPKAAASWERRSRVKSP